MLNQCYTIGQYEELITPIVSQYLGYFILYCFCAWVAISVAGFLMSALFNYLRFNEREEIEDNIENWIYDARLLLKDLKKHFVK